MNQRRAAETRANSGRTSGARPEVAGAPNLGDSAALDACGTLVWRPCVPFPETLAWSGSGTPRDRDTPPDGTMAFCHFRQSGAYSSYPRCAGHRAERRVTSDQAQSTKTSVCVQPRSPAPSALPIATDTDFGLFSNFPLRLLLPG
jgi:hypothetical protein